MVTSSSCNEFRLKCFPKKKLIAALAVYFLMLRVFVAGMCVIWSDTHTHTFLRFQGICIKFPIYNQQVLLLLWLVGFRLAYPHTIQEVSVSKRQIDNCRVYGHDYCLHMRPIFIYNCFKYVFLPNGIFLFCSTASLVILYGYSIFLSIDFPCNSYCIVHCIVYNTHSTLHCCKLIKVWPINAKQLK